MIGAVRSRIARLFETLFGLRPVGSASQLAWGLCPEAPQPNHAGGIRRRSASCGAAEGASRTP
eukprot:13458016-Alexandrium_andersonii.AAC.1